jgi:predicted nucleic acid-binding protein
VASDQHHARAVAAWAELLRSKTRCFASNLVLDETFTLLARRAGYAFAAQRARNILDSAALHILRPEAVDERQALAFFEKYADQKASFTDCVSFALMRRHRIGRAFSFDRHFEIAGFELWGC